VKTTQVHSVAVRGVVAAVPGDPVDVAALEVGFDAAEVSKIAKTVGLSRLHRAPAGQTATDLCVAAARELLADLDWAPESVDGVVLVTQTPDHFLPASACVAHGRLGLAPHAFAFDVGMGCSGYVYGLMIAGRLLSADVRRVLVLAGDTISHLTSPDDKSVAVLFGDAGSATALEYDAQARPMAFVAGTDGSGAMDLCVPAGAFRRRPDGGATARAADDAGNLRAPADLYMDGLSIFNFTLERVPPLVRGTLAAGGWATADVDAFVLHQANGFILGTLARKLGLPRDRVPVNIERYGNTSLASIPLLLADDLAPMLTRSEPSKLVLAGFGVGFSWAGAAVTADGVRSARVVRVG
jgi:3-oxoacyl-[acyl-carrier-protein] synthase-3